MNFLSRVRRWLALVLLRGRLLDWWTLRRGRQWDSAYRAEIAKNLKAAIVPVSPPVFASRRLRQILLIADCQWEQNDLAPELARIAETHLLNLRTILKNVPKASDQGHSVVNAVRQFAKENCSVSPDVILLYLRPALLSEEVFEVVRRQWKCPLFGMSLDDRQEFFPFGIFSGGKDNYQRWVTKFDLNITNCLPATEWYHRLGAACVYSPQGVHITPELVMPTSANFKYKISFLGSKKVERAAIIDELGRAGISVSLFGGGWPNSQWVENPNNIFRDTQINLGIGYASPSLSLTTVKGRDFECPGVGACYLTIYSWELPLHWELGKEILCYRSLDELIEIYGWYGKRQEDCLRIAQAAWRRAIAEHTWEKRFRKIFERSGFKR